MDKKFFKKASEFVDECEKNNIGSLILLEGKSDEVSLNSKAISEKAIVIFIENFLIDSEFALNEVTKIIGNIMFAKELNKQFNIENENKTLH